MGEIRVDPARLLEQAQRLATAALEVDEVTLGLRRCRAVLADSESTAALDRLVLAVDHAGTDLATVAGEVAVTLGDVAVTYALVDGQR